MKRGRCYGWLEDGGRKDAGVGDVGMSWIVEELGGKKRKSKGEHGDGREGVKEEEKAEW
jgi:hypothetical protein